eukprot:scaffold129386_cov19-Tisochrysis_lutea.AAC.1
MFVTNVFFIPFLALRAAPEPETASGSGTSSNQQAKGRAERDGGCMSRQKGSSKYSLAQTLLTFVWLSIQGLAGLVECFHGYNFACDHEGKAPIG